MSLGRDIPTASAVVAMVDVEEFLRKVADRRIGNEEATAFFAACSDADKARVLAALESLVPEAPPAKPNGRADGHGAAAKAAAGSLRGIRTNQNCTEAQKAFIRDFVERSAARTATSKTLAARYRPHLADQRTPANFNALLKEIQYPLTFERAEGAYLYDVDGNRYVDIAGDFGVNLFGHAPAFLKKALNEQIERGWALTGRYAAMGEASELFCELTGHERVAFCQSGSEALMCALRLARAYTDRQKLVLFANSYHGHADVFLNPYLAGVSEAASHDVIPLKYGSAEALEEIAKHAKELAAVFVEPVQSEAIDLQPVEFLKRLRALTTRHGIVLIFDEMISGFRAGLRGCQGLFSVEADLATYGKIVGGGITAGAVAGRAAIMDWSDGGDWKYGDASKPGPTTYIAGTHTQNPIKMAATLAVLEELKKVSPKLQGDLARKTAALAQRLNAYAAENGLPFEVVSFASQFKFRFRARQFTLTQALFLQLVKDKGVNYFLHGNCFLTAAHSDADIETIYRAVRDSLVLLRDEGFFYDDGKARPADEPAERPVSRSYSDTSKPAAAKPSEAKSATSKAAATPPVVVEKPPVVEILPPLAAARADIQLMALDEQKIMEGLRDLVGGFLELSPDDFNEDDDLASLGVDSIIMTGILKAISNHFGVKLSLKKLDGAETIAEIARALVREIPLALPLDAASADEGEDAEDAVEADSEAPKTFFPDLYDDAELEDEPAAPALSARGNGGGNGAAHAPASQEGPARSSAKPATPPDAVAIIGMSVNLPGAPDLRRFWRNLMDGKSSITEIPENRWDWRRYYSTSGEKGTTPSKWGGFVEGHDGFDPLFFKISPREAKYMDPQERLLLMHCYGALEDAGLNPATLAGSQTGVFVGYEYEHYADRLRELHFAIPDLDPIMSGMSARPWYLANRLSFVFDWKGPSEAVNINCAASAVSVYRACRALAGGEAELAVAGGVCLNIVPNSYLDVVELLSPDGTTRVFDENANGYTKGEGCAIVVLKRLDDALRDNNAIYGVIRGCRQSYRGHGNSLSEIKVDAVGAVIAETRKAAGVGADKVRYIEVNGYATKKSDAAEYEGIKAAMKGAQDCGLGCLKANIGNLEPVSGVASLVKVALALENGALPPTIGVEQVNDLIDIGSAGNPLHIQDRAVALDALRVGDERICAGVNSFADSGVNVHILVEEPPAAPPSRQSGEQLFVISARSRAALGDYLQSWLLYLRDNPKADLARLAFSAQTGREAFQYRFACVAGDVADLLDKLEAAERGEARAGCFFGQAAPGKDASRTKTNGHAPAPDDLVALAQAWTEGGAVDWYALHPGALPQVLHQLPTYPFSLKRYWLEVPKDAVPEAARAALETPSAPPREEPVAPPAAPSPLPRAETVAVAPAREPAAPNPVAAFDPVAPPPMAATMPAPAPMQGEVLAGGDALAIMRRLRAIVLGFLEIAPTEEINEYANFAEIGLTSMSIVLLIDEINREFGLELPEIIAFDYPNLVELSAHIASLIGSGPLPASVSALPPPMEIPLALEVPAAPAKPDLDAVLAQLTSKNMTVEQALALIDGKAP